MRGVAGAKVKKKECERARIGEGESCDSSNGVGLEEESGPQQDKGRFKSKRTGVGGQG